LKQSRDYLNVDDQNRRGVGGESLQRPIAPAGAGTLKPNYLFLFGGKHMNMRKILAGVVAGVLAATCVVTAGAATATSSLYIPEATGAKAAAFTKSSNQVMVNAVVEDAYFINDVGVSKSEWDKVVDPIKLAQGGGTYSDGGVTFSTRKLNPTFTVDFADFLLSKDAANGTTIYMEQNHDNSPWGLNGLRTNDAGVHGTPAGSKVRVISATLTATYASKVTNTVAIISTDANTKVTSNIIDWNTNKAVIGFDTFVKGDSLLYGLIESVKLDFTVMQTTGASATDTDEWLVKNNSAEGLAALYGAPGYGGGLWSNAPVVTAQEMNYYGSVDYSVLNNKTIIPAVWIDQNGVVDSPFTFKPAANYSFALPPSENGRILVQDVEVIRNAKKATITLNMSGEDTWNQHFIMAIATTPGPNGTQIQLGQSSWISAGSTEIVVEIDDPALLSSNDSAYYYDAGAAGVPFSNFDIVRQVDVTLMAYCTATVGHGLANGIYPLSGSDVKGTVLGGSLVIDDGAEAAPDETTAAAGDETSDTEPEEVEPDPEEVDPEPEETEPEDVDTLPEDIETEPEETEPAPVEPEETTTVAEAVDTAPAAAGDTDAAGNPKTGVALALIPALVAGAAVTIARKRK
jgi:hypothetical protein